MSLVYIMRSFKLFHYSVVYKMDSKKLKICAFMLYEFKLGNTAANAEKRICSVCGEDSVSERTAQKWFKRFKEGNESLEDKPRFGRPSVIEDDELREYMRSNPRKNV